MHSLLRSSTHIPIYVGRLRLTSVLRRWMATKFSLNIFRLLKDELDVSFLYFLGSVIGWTIETRCLFRRFSIVLPKTLLFMSLKKSFSKSFFALARDRKSTRLNSSHSQISYAVFCLKKKKTSTV